MRRVSPQQSFEFRRPPRADVERDKPRGGRRDGAGRKRSGRAGVSHLRRRRFSSARPLHVTVRVRPEAAGLRRRAMYRLVRALFCETCEQRRFRIIHYAVLHNHVHLVVEASDRAHMTAGMRRVCIRLARRLNRALGRRGPVLADRYHEVHLGSPNQVRNALAYVLCNARRHAFERHGPLRGAAELDYCSSARFFDGWKEAAPIAPPGEGDPVSLPRTWLLRIGWRKRGRISIATIPAS